MRIETKTTYIADDGAELKVIPMTEEEYEVRDSLKEYQEGLIAAANKFDITSIVKK